MKFRELILSEGKEEAQNIRMAIKKNLGLSSRDVSVKSRNGGTSSSVTVTIKNMKALAKRKEIESIGNSEENYDRDEATGEILGGGNTFIFIELDYKFSDLLTSKINKEVEKEAKGSLEIGEKVTIFKTFNVYNQDGTFVVSLKTGGQVSTTYNENGIGSTVLNLISKIGDDSLYSKIK